jgi:hypothetical protein
MRTMRVVPSAPGASTSVNGVAIATVCLLRFAR